MSRNILVFHSGGEVKKGERESKKLFSDFSLHPVKTYFVFERFAVSLCGFHFFLLEFGEVRAVC